MPNACPSKALNDVIGYGDDRVEPVVGADLNPFVRSVLDITTDKTMYSGYSWSTKPTRREKTNNIAAITMRVDDIRLRRQTHRLQAAPLSDVAPRADANNCDFHSVFRQRSYEGMVAFILSDSSGHGHAVSGSLLGACEEPDHTFEAAGARRSCDVENFERARQMLRGKRWLVGSLPEIERARSRRGTQTAEILEQSRQ